MLKTRVITAIVLLAVFLPVTLFAPVGAFGALIAFVLVFAAWEWARLLKVDGVGPVVYALLAAVALVASTKLGTGMRLPRPLFQAAAVFWVLAGPYVLLRKPTLAHGAWRLFLFIAGIVAFVACWHALVAARMAGVPFVLSLMLVVWLADIGAYFAGKAFGRHKLAPAISPGKTWEGAVGGWLAVVIVASAAIVLHAFRTDPVFRAAGAPWRRPHARRADGSGGFQRRRRSVRIDVKTAGRGERFKRPATRARWCP